MSLQLQERNQRKRFRAQKRQAYIKKLSHTPSLQTGPKLQIRHIGDKTYSVKSTGMSASVKQNTKSLLNRVKTATVIVDNRKMSKQKALAYIIGQLTKKLAVSVKIV